MTSVQGRWTKTAGLAAVAGIAWAVVACSSDSSSSTTSTLPVASSTAPAEPEIDPGVLTPEQLAALDEAAAAFDDAEQVLVTAFDAVTVVPKLERWQETETAHQEAVGALRDALPEGGCRAALDALLAIEEGQNTIRQRLIENYREEDFGLVADDTVAYGVSVVNGAVQAEEEIAVACGRSSVDPSRSSAAAGSLTPEQTALFDAVLAAYGATSEAFEDVFSISEFTADLEALQEAEALVAAELDEVLALLGDGECRVALGEVRALEQQQSDLRTAMITAGQAGDIVTMIRTLGEYTEVNSVSEPFTTARRSAVDSCGAEL